MTSPVPGAGGDSFLTQLLGDLMSLMGGAGAQRLDLARQLAQQVATGGLPEPNVDPVDRIRLEELLRVAELHVAELTGLSPAADGTALSVDAVGPGAWARYTVDDWSFVLDALAVPVEGAGLVEADDGDLDEADDGDLERGGAEVLAQFVAGMGPMFAALQLGSAVGHLARTTLGQYEIPIWRPRPALLMVPGNVTRFAEEWSLPADDVRLWVSLREVTVHGVLGRPHVRGRITELITDVVRGTATDTAGLVEQLQHLDLSDPGSLEQVLGDPSSLLNAEPSPARRRASEELNAITTALLGYVEHVLDRTATRLLGGRGALAEAWRRRQLERDSASRTAEMLFGLDLGPDEVERGAQFVAGVVERAGEEGLARLWSAPATLPTPAEIAAPGLWLERISFEVPEQSSE
ncbi:MAG TPA: zinc-dependent metalloprotease [Acidimicrobiales bacterium]|nr:zinc-dependent metalloprotease [Acidimicrobiales bacterium]